MILVINCGSSSVKFAVMAPIEQTMLVSGLAEKLGTDAAEITIKIGDKKEFYKLGNASHVEALAQLGKSLRANHILEKISAVGHRIVHGGSYFSDSVLVTEDTVAKIAECSQLAPLHNPAHLIGIEVVTKQLPDMPQVVVFDTAFHQTMPEHAYLYATPRSWERDYHVRRYGFHGTSHRYITQKTAELLGKPQSDLNIISAHLGNGSSVAAIRGGKSVDTSMGFTPLAGLIMGTRTGDIDPAIIPYMSQQLGLDDNAVVDIMNKKSGLLGISELTNDCRELTDAALKGHAGAQLALDMFCYRLATYIAKYMVPLQRLDALVFTGGIGENSAIVREKVLSHLQFLGFKLDAVANDQTFGGKTALITTEGSTRAMVVNTNEELMIALDTHRLTRSSGETRSVSFGTY